MNEAATMKKKMLPPILVPMQPFADISAGFSGVFPGSSPDLIGPARASHDIASCIFLSFQPRRASFAS